MTKKRKGSPTIQLRVPENQLVQWNRFCEEKNTDVSKFLRYAANLIIMRPELWDDPKSGEIKPEQISEELLIELKELILNQERKIEDLKIELGELNQIELIRETEFVKEVLKERVFAILANGKEMIQEEIREQITDPGLQRFIRPAPGKAFCVLDDVITVLLREQLITFNRQNKSYSSSLDSI